MIGAASGGQSRERGAQAPPLADQRNHPGTGTAEQGIVGYGTTQIGYGLLSRRYAGIRGVPHSEAMAQSPRRRCYPAGA